MIKSICSLRTNLLRHRRDPFSFFSRWFFSFVLVLPSEKFSSTNPINFIFNICFVCKYHFMDFSRRNWTLPNFDKEMRRSNASIIPSLIDRNRLIHQDQKVFCSLEFHSMNNPFSWLLFLPYYLDFPLVISSFLVAMTRNKSDDEFSLIKLKIRRWLRYLPYTYLSELRWNFSIIH